MGWMINATPRSFYPWKRAPGPIIKALIIVIIHSLLRSLTLPGQINLDYKQRFIAYRAVNTLGICYIAHQFMLCREIMCARMGEGRGVHRVLVGKPEGKRPLGRPRRRWEDNIKMDLQEVGGGCGDWMELAEDRERWRALVSTVMNFRVP